MLDQNLRLAQSARHLLIGFFAMRGFISTILAGLLGLSPIAAASVSLAADALYEAVPDHDGVCGNPRITGKISQRFRYQVTHVPHQPDVRITQFRNIHQHRYYARSEDWPIGRRYCGATVDLSDGTHREAWYMIEEGMGFAGALDALGMAGDVRGSNVEFCVSGFDRWLVYNGRCRILR